MYYENIIKKIKKLIETKKYSEAYKILTNELSVDYIPDKYNSTLNELFDITTRNMFVEQEKTNVSFKISHDHIKMALNNSNELNYLDQAKYIGQLGDINPLPLLNEIEAFLCKDSNNNVLKTLVIESLHRTPIDKELKIIKFGYEFQYNPKNYTSIIKDLNFINLKNELYNKYFINSPNLFSHAFQIAEFYFFSTFPKKMNSDEIFYIFNSIVYFLLLNFNIRVIDKEQYCLQNNCDLVKFSENYEQLLLILKNSRNQK